MRKYDLFYFGESIVRVLEIQPERVLIIDCIKKVMPTWMDVASLRSCAECINEGLFKATAFTPIKADELDASRRKTMYERYTIIAPLLPFLGNRKLRSQVIQSVAAEHGISQQTVRNYLCQYLAYQDITVLAPQKRTREQKLSPDEKNIRWALNKFFYTTAKQTLMTAYTMMLKEKYCDATGTLQAKYPSFYQFRYYYRKTRKLQNFYISRDGLTNYQRNNRPLTGEGIQKFAPAVGTGMLDATICDIYLVNDAGDLVGRPILTACIDAYSGLCCGYFLSWEGGVYSLRGLMKNVIADKVEWCKQFGIEIQQQDWDCNRLPATLVTDMGSEYRSETFEQIADLGVKVVNLPSYRPELKGAVEKFFDLVQEAYKKHLKGKGVIEPNFQERGAPDYRKDACLTMSDFEKILLHCIVYYNSRRIVERFPYTEEMIAAQVQPYASRIWAWGKSQAGANLILVTAQELTLTLLPRTTGKFGRTGLIVNKIRYHRDGYTEQYLAGGAVTVAYNPEDVTSVWVLEKGVYTEFIAIGSRFKDKSLATAQGLQTAQRAIVKEAARSNLQAQIDLAQQIEAIAHSASDHADVHIENIRSTRKREKIKRHRDYVKEELNHA